MRLGRVGRHARLAQLACAGRHACLAGLGAVALAACATLPQPSFDAAALATQMARAPIVLLGEVHDNAAQHAVRAAALQRFLDSGARPALAFEQFDRSRQADLDQARADPLPPGASRADHLIERAGGRGWDWSLYRPMIELALRHDLPIVAANLSRADAMRVVHDGFGALFDAPARRLLGLDQLPPGLLAQQERAVDAGHCHRLPPEALAGLARAQIARDATLALVLRDYAGRGVVLLTGNGHARKDIGVPLFLGALRGRSVSIGLLERSPGDAGAPRAAHDADDDGAPSARAFDVIFLTPPQPRPDPCRTLPAPVG